VNVDPRRGGYTEMEEKVKEGSRRCGGFKGKVARSLVYTATRKKKGKKKKFPGKKKFYVWGRKENQKMKKRKKKGQKEGGSGGPIFGFCKFFLKPIWVTGENGGFSGVEVGMGIVGKKGRYTKNYFRDSGDT